MGRGSLYGGVLDCLYGGEGLLDEGLLDCLCGGEGLLDCLYGGEGFLDSPSPHPYPNFLDREEGLLGRPTSGMWVISGSSNSGLVGEGLLDRGGEGFLDRGGEGLLDRGGKGLLDRGGEGFLDSPSPHPYPNFLDREEGLLGGLTSGMWVISIISYEPSNSGLVGGLLDRGGEGFLDRGEEVLDRGGEGLLDRGGEPCP